MKKTFSIATVIIILTACQLKTSAQSNSSFKMPWYSTNFEIGDQKYAQIILKLYKDYTNNIFKDDDVFADTASMDFASGKYIKGKDSLNNMVKAFRNSLASVATELTTYIVAKPKDKDVTWVSVWGKETDQYKDGRKNEWYFNENWMFNKDGKVAYISQYNAK